MDSPKLSGGTARPANGAEDSHPECPLTVAAPAMGEEMPGAVVGGSCDPHLCTGLARVVQRLRLWSPDAMECVFL